MLDVIRHGPTETHAAWAKATKMSPSSVRRRLAKLQEAGVLLGFVTVPAPQVLGLTGVAATWKETADAKAFLSIPGTIMVGTNVSGGTLAGGFSNGEWLEAATNMLGSPQTVSPLGSPEAPTLGKMDLRVLRAMVEKPRGTAQELADLSGLNAKTVRKRKAMMVTSGALEVHPIVHVSASDACIVHLHATGPRDAMEAVKALLKDASIGKDTDPILCAFVRSENLGEQARLLASIKKLGVEVDVVTEDAWEINHQAILSMIDAAIAAWD